MVQGDFNRMSSYTDSPLEMALRFEGSGIRRIHIVDLDGARDGRPVNLHILEDISRSVNLDIEWGGGIKSAQDIDSVLNAGAGHVICGTVAARNPDLFSSWLDSYPPGRIILGADVRGLEVATHGWTKGSGTDIFSLVGQFLPFLTELIVTDIARDGMLGGPAVELYSRIMKAFPTLTLTASGGVGSMDDISSLEEAGVPRVIVGKAIYEQKISMEEIKSWLQRG